MDKFKHVDTWVFDLDNTLYDANLGVFDRMGDRMTLYVAELLKLPLDKAATLRRHYWDNYGTTLYGLMQEHKIDPDHFLDFAHQIDISDVPQCDIVKGHLEHLPGRKVLFTNSSRDFAQRMTKHLGINHHFDHFFSIEDGGYLPKPKREPYEAVLRNFDIDPKKATMFEDMAVNLKTAHDLGMTTVWIHGKNNDPKDHAHDHLHHKTETLAHWLKQTVPHHPTKGK